MYEAIYGKSVAKLRSYENGSEIEDSTALIN